MQWSLNSLFNILETRQASFLRQSILYLTELEAFKLNLCGERRENVE